MKNVNEPTFGDGIDRARSERQARAGAALVGRGAARSDQLTVAVDADLTTTATRLGDERHVAGGGEVWMAQRRLGLRGGAAQNTIGDSRTRRAPGSASVTTAASYVDGAVTGGSDRDDRMELGLSVTF